MGLLSLVDRNTCLSPRQGSAYLASQAIYVAGAEGLAWRVKSGVVRLDTNTKNGGLSFASLAVSAGRSLYDVQALLGHASPSMTTRYAHLDNQTLRAASQTVADVVTRAKVEATRAVEH